jgi:ribose transport system ATP-binding protein
MPSRLTIKGLSKNFGGTQALDRINLEARAGEVLAVIGENGAGKSTLMKVLAGVTPPDAGAIILDKQPHSPENPAAARMAGVALVPQEAELAPHLSVGENIVLGREPTRRGFIQWQSLYKQAARALELVTSKERSIDCRRRARDLSPSERQLVVIARAFALANLRILIFDEPTSSLTAADAKRLFEVIQRLKQQRIVILYVSHFLEEVLTIADRYCVLRDGRLVAHGSISDTTATELVTKMAGKDVAERKRRQVINHGAVMLDLRELSGHLLPKEVTFELRAGEVFGIAGLVGAGRTELVRAVFGLDRVKSGQVRVKTFEGPFRPAECLKLGLGLLSEDRRGEGLAQSLSVTRNITMSKLKGWGPFVTSKREQLSARPFIERLSIRCRDPEQPVAELSGGNQQKVALARLLHHDVDIMLLDEPTRGIDVRSRLDVHRCIDELAERGKAILLISSYLPELLSLCDTIAVMCRGKLGEPKAVSEWDEHSLLMEATGVE